MTSGLDLTLTVEADPSVETSAHRCDQLFVLIDGERPLAPSSRHLLDGIDEVHVGRSSIGIDASRRDTALTVAVPDRRVSSAHARLIRAPDGWWIEDLGSKNGTYVDSERVTTRVQVPDGAVLSIGHTFFLLLHDRRAGGHLDQLAHHGAGPLVTLSCGLERTFAELARVATTDTAILLVGESGTGKERVARAVHALAGRRGDFVAVGCGGLPANMWASELFGHVKGAFAGADADRPGLIASADGGTLFLDELGDLGADIQPALLRVLQEREVLPIGGARPRPVDLRVVSATHREPELAVASGQLRADLVGRLDGFTLRLPPLRHRREDLGVIIASILARHAPHAEALAFTRRALRALLMHPWPGNIRELESAIKVSLALAGDDEIATEHLPQPLRTGEARPSEPPGHWPAPALAPAPAPGIDPAAPDPSPREQRRAAMLIQLLGEHGGNVAAVARALGKQRTLVHRWLRRLQIDPERYRR